MTDHPLLFKPHMAQGVHDGSKTMTRRIIKNQDLFGAPPQGFEPYWFKHNETLADKFGFESDDDTWVSPYQICDQLWVKEVHYEYGFWELNGVTRTGRQKKSFKGRIGIPILFPNNPPEKVCTGFNEIGYFKRNSLFMPKKHCRTWIEITGIRVERLQDISEEDAIKEGCEIGHGLDDSSPFFAKDAFETLWDSINGHPRKDGKDISWAANPWTWAIEFKRIEK